jgi:hypothetical protein
MLAGDSFQNQFDGGFFENATTRILQSKFFNPTFNTAIFDGPLRVYFAQQQEPEAMKVYFSLQAQIFKENNVLTHLRDHFPKDSTLFVMIYPTKESFQQSFDCDKDYAYEKMGQDYVIGVQGPISESVKDNILSHIQDKFLLPQYDFK